VGGVRLAEVRIRVALGADRRTGAVAGRHQRFIGQREKFLVDRFQNVFGGTAPQVRSANAALEKCVAGYQAHGLI